MITGNDIRAGMRVLDSDGDFIGTVVGVYGDDVRLRPESDAQAEHNVPMSRFDRTDGQSVYLDSPWATILTTLGGLAAGAAATISGAANATGRAVDRATDGDPRTGVTGTDYVREPVRPVTADHVVRDTHVHREVPVEPKKSSIWPWILLGVALLAALWALSQCAKKPVEPAPAPVPTEQTTTTTTTTETVTLPGGETLAVAPNTITYDLAKFLGSNAPAPKTFTFDKLNFDTGSSAIRAEDQATIDSIAKLMAAYPAVKASIVGYADATGDKAANAKLSGERAAAVVKAIAAKGIDAGRLNSKAGGEIPTGGASQSARRTDLVVTAR